MAKAGPLPRERLKHGGQRKPELYDYRDGTHYCWDILAGSHGLGAGMAEHIRKAQKLGPGHPQTCSLHSQNPGHLRRFLFCTFRIYPASSPFHPAASFPLSCLPCFHPRLFISAQRKLSKVTSHHSSAPNPPRPSCHRSWELKPCPCWGLEHFTRTPLHLFNPSSAPGIQPPRCSWNIPAHSCLGASLSKQPESGQEEATDQRSEGRPCPSLKVPANTLKAGSQVTSLAFYFCLEFQGS